MKGIISAVGGVLLTFATLAVQATPISCATSDVTGNLGGSTACEGPTLGNSPFPGDLTVAGWGTFEAVTKYEVDEDLIEGDDIGLVVTSLDGFISGTWSFNPGLGFEAFVIVLKAGNEFSAYLFDGAAADSFSGTWEVPSKFALSHFDVYAQPGDDVDVPEPGALGLMLLGLPVLWSRRRRLN